MNPRSLDPDQPRMEKCEADKMSKSVKVVRGSPVLGDLRRWLTSGLSDIYVGHGWSWPANFFS